MLLYDREYLKRGPGCSKSQSSNNLECFYKGTSKTYKSKGVPAIREESLFTAIKWPHALISLSPIWRVLRLVKPRYWNCVAGRSH